MYMYMCLIGAHSQTPNRETSNVTESKCYTNHRRHTSSRGVKITDSCCVSRVSISPSTGCVLNADFGKLSAIACFLRCSGMNLSSYNKHT